MNSPFLKYFLATVVSFGLSYTLVPLCRYVSLRTDWVDRPGAHKTHENPTPLFGGIAVFLSVWGTLFLFASQNWINWGTQLRGLFLGSLLILTMGLIDDIVEINPFWKILFQAGATVVVIAHNVSLSLFIGPNWITYSLTALWIIGITNSFNLLDNMDGLACGVAAICSFIFALNSYRQGDPQTILLSVILGGALIAFLRFNFEPAVIFLGDAGSGFIGFFLAVLSVAANYLETSQLQQLPIVTPILIFSLPLFDTFSVMIIRLLEGRSIWDADNRHFSHRLVSLGLEPRYAVMVIYLISFTVGSLALLLGRVELTDALLLLVHAFAIFAIIVILEFASVKQDE